MKTQAVRKGAIDYDSLHLENKKEMSSEVDESKSISKSKQISENSLLEVIPWIVNTQKLLSPQPEEKLIAGPILQEEIGKNPIDATKIHVNRNIGKKVVFGILFSVFMNIFAYSETCTAILTGDWSVASTWSCGHTPTNYDTVVIPFGKNVTMDINSPVYVNMVVRVYGIMTFDVGQKINICPGEFEVFASGRLDGGVPGSKINICGQTMWNGPGPEWGPLFWSNWPLPIQLSSFDGVQNDNTIILSWTTQTETNNDYFTIERTIDGITFETIGRIEGNGTSSQLHNYSFDDESPKTGKNYYRLTQTDFNGHYERYAMIAIDFINANSGCVFSVYPNPSSSNFTVSFSDCPNDNAENISIQIIDPLGQVIAKIIPEKNDLGGFTFILEREESWKQGLYIIQRTSSTTTYQQKLVLE